MTVKDLWFSPGTPVSSTNKTDRLDIAEILLKVALNTIYHKTIYSNVSQPCLKEVGTAYPSRALGFTPGFFLVGPVLHIFLVLGVVCLVLFVFVLCLVYPLYPVSLDCPFLLAPSVFSNVYFAKL